MATALILAVGQDFTILTTRTAILQRAGYFVEPAYSVVEAITRFHDGDFDLVVLCHTIPATERNLLARAIRASGAGTPILLASSFADDCGLADRVIDSHPERLLQSIEAALKQAGTLYPAKEAETNGNIGDNNARFTVLCIDDEPNSLYIRRLLLEKAGYNVLTSDNCDYCLGILSTGIVDAVILDYAMPGMNGGEVAVRMRKIRQDIPLILYSGLPNLPEGVLALFDASISKSASPQVLIATLRRILSDRGKKWPQAQATTEDHFKYGTFP